MIPLKLYDRVLRSDRPYTEWDGCLTMDGVPLVKHSRVWSIRYGWGRAEWYLDPDYHGSAAGIGPGYWKRFLIVSYENGEAEYFVVNRDWDVRDYSLPIFWDEIHITPPPKPVTEVAKYKFAIRPCTPMTCEWDWRLSDDWYETREDACEALDFRHIVGEAVPETKRIFVM